MTALILEMGGRAGAGEIIDLYLRELDSRTAAVRTAADPTALGGAAHALGSPSSLVGAERLALRCREIEVLVRDGRPVGPDLLDGLVAECARARDALEGLRAGLPEPESGGDG